jgi:3-oxoacyl-[acyl-carrier protein] reductase
MTILEKRVVLITGASRGIGAATARLLAKHGAAVAVNYVNNAAAAERVVQDITREDGRAIAVRADVRVRDEVERMVRTVGEQLGTIDTLILNAHIDTTLAPIVNQSWEAFEAKIMGEMKAAFYCVQAVTPGMLENKKGCIVATSSSTAQHPTAGTGGQSVAKSALDALMRVLAIELGPAGIRVNMVAPGLTLTETSARLPEQIKGMVAGMTPLGRNGLPEDVAGAILMLVLDEAGFVTGNTLSVDGGMHIGPSALNIRRRPE